MATKKRLLTSECYPTPGRSHGTQRSPGPAVVLGRLNLPPSLQHWSSGEKFWLISYTATLVYCPISPVCDQYVKYLLVGANPSVLNQHRWGLQP
jgi:hypothetical protein